MNNLYKERVIKLTQQINPVFVQQLTDKPIEEIPQSPTVSWLPGEYTKLINRQKDNIDKFFEENNFMLTCKSCGRRGKYDVGLMVVNEKNMGAEEGEERKIQTTGYFRCKHCNDAGNWEMPNDFSLAAMAGLLSKISDPDAEGRSTLGKNVLYDGTWHEFSSDAEMHYLHKLRKEPNRSFLWNRLGNLYNKGSRPELAVCAFEHSIALDPSQIESHYTLGDFLFKINEFEKSSYHFKQTLIFASDYKELAPESLRDFIASALQNLFWIFQETDGKIAFLPTVEELNEAGKLKEVEKNRADMEIEVFPDDLESLYPFAEIYMGSQSKKIPKRLRTLKKPVPVKRKKARHKKKRKK